MLNVSGILNFAGTPRRYLLGGTFGRHNVRTEEFQQIGMWINQEFNLTKNSKIGGSDHLISRLELLTWFDHDCITIRIWSAISIKLVVFNFSYERGS